MQLDVLQAPPDDDKAPGAFKTISEAAGELDVPPHVLRFWESHFSQIKPLKLRGGRRYYRPEDMDALFTIKRLLYQQGYTIKGARKLFNSRKQAEVEPVEEASVDGGRRQQLTEICRELMAMRETLKGYLR